ncbi:MAG: N-acetyl sugar amidotransferase [Rhodothermales bacterium]
MSEIPVTECTRCIMSTKADKNIIFNEAGLCNHCERYDKLLASRVSINDDSIFESVIDKIKKAGRGKEYDCLIGVSGGVDSTYVAYLVKQHGLRPLAVHLDNGWDSELATSNIKNTLEKLGIDLHTHVIDWKEFKDLQLSFLKASLPDGEVPSDHAIFALMWREAAKRKIKYIVSGMNFQTESISVPEWSYGHSDWKYIRAVHKKFGSSKLRTYPRFTFPYLAYIYLFKGVRTVSLLNYVKYDKQKVLYLIQDKLGWRNYGGKHHESIYTRFYQGYVLPKKFGIDKRYGHLSDLINSGQLSKEDALKEIKKPPYSEELQQEDKIYVCKKFGISVREFDEIMKLPPKLFYDYPNGFKLLMIVKRIVNYLRLKRLYPK